MIIKASDLKDYTATHWLGIKEMTEILNSENVQMQDLYDKIQSVADDVFILTMGITTLKRWETLLKITPEANSTIVGRRVLVLNRLLGTKKLNSDLIIKMFAEYPYITVSVVFEDSTIKVQVRSSEGIPSNMFSIDKALQKMKPSHLGLSWNMVSDAKTTTTNFNAVCLLGETITTYPR